MSITIERPANDYSPSLLGTRFSSLSQNTYESIGYFQNSNPTKQEVLDAVRNAPVLEDSSLQLYIHIPFCYNNCTFCAFTGANDTNTQVVDHYTELVIWQLKDFLNMTKIKGRHIESVHIGGGSPDLLGRNIGKILRTVRDLEGCDKRTEISVEMSLNTTKPEFIEELVEYNTTKVSFGIQTFDPLIRKQMRQPSLTEYLPKVMDMINGRIPVINADILSGLPGQTLQIFLSDIKNLMEHPHINTISSYLLTICASPSIVKGLATGELPPQASQHEQALMRLYYYSVLLQNQWVKGGTVTYVDPKRVSSDVIEILSGNECHGQNSYSSFQLSVGAKAISFLPGIQLENISDLHEWCKVTERGEQPFYLPKCSVKELKDIALWAFPLRPEGLPYHRYEWMVKNNALSEAQINALENLCHEGYVMKTQKGFELSILGEVFRGHIIRELKKEIGREMADKFVNEGHELGMAIAKGNLEDNKMINNRQLAEKHLNN